MVLLGLGQVAHAQLEYRIAAEATVGVTDNARSQREEEDVRGDGFASGRGHLLVSYVGAVSRAELSYGITATSWFREAGSPMLAQTLRLLSEIDASPALRIGLSTGATLTQLTMIDMHATADPRTSGPRPAEDHRFLSLDARETIAYEWGGSWRLSQGLTGSLYHPLGDGTNLGDTKTLTLDAAIHRLWARDQAGLNGRMGVTTAAGSAAPPWRTTELAQLQLAWRHEWTPATSHQLEAGVTAVNSDRIHVLPSGTATFSWHAIGRELELRAARTADSSMYTGLVYERSLVGLRVSFLLDNLETLGLVAAVDLEHASILSGSTGQTGAANVLFARCGLHWRPASMFIFGIEYNIRDQRSTTTGTGAGTSAMPTFRRQLAMLSIEVRFPDERR